MPRNIDVLFEHFTATMGLLRNILIEKSEMTRLGKKISEIVNNQIDPDLRLLQANSFASFEKSLTEGNANKKRKFAYI